MGQMRLMTVVMLAVLGCMAQTAVAMGMPTADTTMVTVDSTSQRYDAFFMEAMVQRQKGNHDAAFDLLKHCLEIRPDASEAHYYLAQYYSALRDNDHALTHLKRAAEIDSQTPIYLETLAQAYIAIKDLDSAISVLTTLAEQDKNRDDILETLLNLYMQQEKYEEAVAMLERLEQVNGRSERLTLIKSEIYNTMGDRKAALAEIKALADQYPNDLGYRAEYASMLLSNGEQKAGLGVLDDILQEEPDNTRALVCLHDYYEGEGMQQKADSIIERVMLSRHTTQEQRFALFRQQIRKSEMAGGDSTAVLQLFHKVLAQPQSDATIAALCATYMSLKEMPRDTIDRALEQVLAIAPDDAAARLQLVRSAWMDEDTDRVIALCQTARQYNPDEMAFYYYQGMTHYQRGEKDEALNTFQNGIGVINDESDPAIVSDFYAIMGDLLHERGQARQAFEAYDSCLQWKDDNLGCLNNYAYYLSELGQQLEKAEEMSRKTIKAESKNATYLDTYAWILFQQKRYAEARIYIDQALQNDSDSSAVIIEHGGDIYALSGDINRAMELWKAAAAKPDQKDNKILFRKIKLKKYLKE